MEAIILAGGLGTRLQGVIGKYPKCMAQVNQKPFLYYIFEYLLKQNCTKVVLSLGYMSEIITDWLAQNTFDFQINVVIETEPLGTGGGMQLAINKALSKDVVVLNGDTMFNIDIGELMNFHKANNASTTIALKEMQNFDRYGVVNTNTSGLITSFEEKKYTDTGMINGGVYVVNKSAFLSKQLPDKFSFENDYLVQYVHEHRFYGLASKQYFIDIGIPADYERAQLDFKTFGK